MIVCCVLSLESPHRGDSNEYTTYHYQYKNKTHLIIPNIIMPAAMGVKNEFEKTVVNDQSAFEPLKFYCMS